MKILSYKILNEATINLFNKNTSALGGNFALGGGISGNLLKTTQLSKKRGIEGASDTLKYMTRYIQLLFNFYDAQNNPQLPNDINVSFGIYFTDSGNKAHILPFYSKSIQDLVEQNLEYATLELFNPQDLTEKINIENYFNNFSDLRYSFKLTIPDTNKFENINNKYGFTVLNQLLNFANQPASTDITIGFNASSGFRRLTLDRSQQGSGQINFTSIAFKITPLQGQTITPNQRQINTLFTNGQQNCTIQFNTASRPSGVNLPNIRYTTKITYQVNKILYIYTNREIKQNLQPQNIMASISETYIQLGNNRPEQCNLQITSLS